MKCINLKNMLESLKRFHENEQGDIVQADIIIGIFAVIAVGSLMLLQPKIKAMFDKAEAELDTAEGVAYQFFKVNIDRISQNMVK